MYILNSSRDVWWRFKVIVAEIHSENWIFLEKNLQINLRKFDINLRIFLQKKEIFDKFRVC